MAPAHQVEPQSEVAQPAEPPLGRVAALQAAGRLVEQAREAAPLEAQLRVVQWVAERLAAQRVALQGALQEEARAVRQVAEPVGGQPAAQPVAARPAGEQAVEQPEVDRRAVAGLLAVQPAEVLRAGLLVVLVTAGATNRTVVGFGD